MRPKDDSEYWEVKNFKWGGGGQFQDMISAFVWKDWGTSRKSSVKIIDY